MYLGYLLHVYCTSLSLPPPSPFPPPLTATATGGAGKHWRNEKVFTVGLLGLIPLGLAYPNAVVDYGLAVAIPLHGHWSVGASIHMYVYVHIHTCLEVHVHVHVPLGICSLCISVVLCTVFCVYLYLYVHCTCIQILALCTGYSKLEIPQQALGGIPLGSGMVVKIHVKLLNVCVEKIFFCRLNTIYQRQSCNHSLLYFLADIYLCCEYLFNNSICHDLATKVYPSQGFIQAFLIGVGEPVVCACEIFLTTPTMS